MNSPRTDGAKTDQVAADTDPILGPLNDRQREAVCHGNGPLLIIAGAGSGKTLALTHRAAYLISQGVEPTKILLLSFTRRSADQMLRRVHNIVRQYDEMCAATQGKRSHGAIWGGTFHATAARLLRMHAKSVGLSPSFSIYDRADSEDLMNVLRTELGLAKTNKRFPLKGTCMDIYSRCINTRQPIEEVLVRWFPWCRDYAAELKNLFRLYTDRKHEHAVLDYDDLLLFWKGLLEDDAIGNRLREQFEYVLVDEYQDTNSLQAEILRLLCPDGQGLTVVGDDAQAIYAFRGATVRNILDFPNQFPGSSIVRLEQNYRSTNAILDVSNRVIAQANERFEKELWSRREPGEPPMLVTCDTEDEQSDFIIDRVLELRESGIPLRRQAALFRTSHHSLALELELGRRNIPFRKFGGLRFTEAAHVKDLLSFLRLAENPLDPVAGMRVLLLLPGIGPKKAKSLMDLLIAAGGEFQKWAAFAPPSPSTEIWPKFVTLMIGLAEASAAELPRQVHGCLVFYTPLLETKYDQAQARICDLERIEGFSSRFPNRQAMLSDLTLDAPSYSSDFAGPPRLDEDYFILSTIHSAKGLEWDAVYVLHASDGCIPSDMATGSAAEIDEELRLFYVALTRAKNSLHVCFPSRYYATRTPMDPRWGYAQLTRFISPEIRRAFHERQVPNLATEGAMAASESGCVNSIRDKVKSLWS